MRVLYKRTDVEVPKSFIPSKIQEDILTNWKYNYNLFSISQIAERNNESRGHVKRKIKQLIKLNLVKKHG